MLPQASGLLTALSVAAVGSYGAYVLNKKQNADTRAKVYAELTSQREQADTLMRKDMFAKIIESVLKKDESSDRAVLNMELLAYNFHESLNLKPLFAYVRRNLDDTAEKQYIARLEKVAQDVTQKQLLVLDGAGKSYDCTIDLKTLQAVPESQSLELGGIERVFTIAVRHANPKTHELDVLLKIMTPPGGEIKDVSFTVGPYDFPMIDNTRLSGDQRFAVVLQSFLAGEAPIARLTMVYFPGSRASLREKTFSEDIIRNLENPRRD
ncbi:MAG TPA: hypothetical protein VLH83_10380 [Chthoniobacterales bacterium]|nr:hypothetical protein [Chthoniobacterales bacterium]